MNETANKFLLAGDKFMPEMHVKQPGCIYSAWWPLTKNKERIQKFKETGESRYIYRNEVDKACFQNNMAYGDFKDLARRTASDKVLRYKAFSIAKNLKYYGFQRGLVSMVYTFFNKKSKISGIENEIKQNEQLTEELHKLITKKIKRGKVYSSFKGNIWGADLANMQLIRKYNKEIRFLLCAIDIFSKYGWVVPLKNKKGITIVDAFQKILNDSKRKPNKIWVYKGSEFYNRSMKSWLEKNSIEMYLTHNEGKSVVAERFIRTLKNKIYKHMTSISKNVYIDELVYIVNKYNNIYHRTIKMKPIDVKDEFGDHGKISKYKNIFAKGYTPNLSEEIFVIKKIKNTVPWTYVINDANGKEIIGTFYKKELKKKQNKKQKEFGIEKVIKKKRNKLYVK